MKDERIDRRTFIQVAIASGAVTVLGLTVGRDTKASSSAGSDGRQWVMVIDQDKCTGCGYCTLACQAHNDVPPDIQWNRVIRTEKLRDRQLFISRPCMHCDHAPCISVCPVKASYKRSDGIVMMDYDRCIGCRYCEVACPYGARAFNWSEFTGDNPAVPEWGQPEVPRRPRGVVEKCSFCYQRIDRGLA
ncbi:MAG: 4Fe-4S dicluster domain-containing protein, partial [Chloroflexota bacterium]